MKNLILLGLLAGANIVALTGCVTNKTEPAVVSEPTTTRTTTSESHTIRAY